MPDKSNTEEGDLHEEDDARENEKARKGEGQNKDISEEERVEAVLDSEDEGDLDDENLDAEDLDEENLDEEDLDEENLDEEDLDEENLDDEDLDDEDLDDEDLDDEDLDDEDLDEEDLDFDLDEEDLDFDLDEEDLDEEDLDEEDLDEEDLDEEDLDEEDLDDEDLDEEDLDLDEQLEALNDEIDDEDEQGGAFEEGVGFVGPEVSEMTKAHPDQVQYLLRSCPFVQVVAGGGVEPADKVTVLTAESSNWPICHYGDAMCTSPGPYILGGGAFRVRFGEDEDDDDGGSGMLNPGKGTVINQAFLTCLDMVQIALKEGWESIHVVDGTRIMGRGLWIYGEREGLIVTGFEPNEEDQRVQYLVSASMDDLRARYTSVSSGPRTSGA